MVREFATLIVTVPANPVAGQILGLSSHTIDALTIASAIETLIFGGPFTPGANGGMSWFSDLPLDTQFSEVLMDRLLALLAVLALAVAAPAAADTTIPGPVTFGTGLNVVGSRVTNDAVPINWSLTGTTAQLSPQAHAGTSLTAPALSILNSQDPPGPQNNFQITAFNQLLIGSVTAAYPWLGCNSRSIDLCGTGGDGRSGAPLVRVNGDFVIGDVGKFGGGDSRALNVGQILGWATSGAIPSPTFVVAGENSQADGGIGGAQVQIMPDSTGCCGAGPYRAGRITAVATPGKKYVRHETIVLNGGSPVSQAVGKVLQVDGSGGIASAYILIGGVYTSPASGTITMTQSSSSGSGTGATFTVEFGPPPFIGTQGAVQIIAYNSDSAGHQVVNFYGRAGPGALGLVAQITERGIRTPIWSTAGGGDTAVIPTCGAGSKYLIGTVTDATTPTYNATYVGGGGMLALVQCDGTNWRTH